MSWILVTVIKIEYEVGSKMNCKEVVASLSDYLDHELQGRDVTGIRIHLKGCQHCSDLLSSLKTTIKLTHDLKSEDIPPEESDRLQAFLKSHINPTNE